MLDVPFHGLHSMWVRCDLWRFVSTVNCGYLQGCQLKWNVALFASLPENYQVDTELCKFHDRCAFWYNPYCMSRERRRQNKFMEHVLWCIFFLRRFTWIYLGEIEWTARFEKHHWQLLQWVNGWYTWEALSRPRFPIPQTRVLFVWNVGSLGAFMAFRCL